MKNELTYSPVAKEVGKAKRRSYIAYFEATYLYGAYDVLGWSHFTNKYERTNKYVEGINNCMKKFCGAANPNQGREIVAAIRNHCSPLV